MSAGPAGPVGPGSLSADPLRLSVLWDRLIAIVDEQAATLIRTAFTPVVAEAEDLAAGVFDAQGRMLAQSLTGTPGHILSLARSVEHFLAAFDEPFEPGDVLICNDPWVTSGHLNDIIVATPVFDTAMTGNPVQLGVPGMPGAWRPAGENPRLVGFLANTCHAIDIGGRGFAAGARETFEEGLLIPFSRLYRRGEPNRDVINFIRGNVRLPDDVLGDLHAQVVANDAGARRLVEFLQEYGLPDLLELGNAILDRTDLALRRAIAALPDGVYRYEFATDGADDPATPLTYRLALTVAGDQLVVDYAGTSSQVEVGINATLSYAMAYTVYALICALLPEVPFNAGAFRTIELRAPEASLVNARRPAPVSARHLKNYALATVTMGALVQVIPERVVAGSPPEWNISILGTGDDGAPFVAALFPAGGMGARFDQDGLSATCFPANVPAMSVEVVEARWPIYFERLAVRPGSGGAGRSQGGCGESIAFRVETAQPARLMCMFDGVSHATPGFQGGAPGALGTIRCASGGAVHPKRELVLKPGEMVEFELPGGGGFGPPPEHSARPVSPRTA